MFDLHGIFKDKPVDIRLFKKKIERLEPGTEEWMKVWKAHPDLQEKMVEYAKNKFVWCRKKEQRVHFLICYNSCKEKCLE